MPVLIDRFSAPFSSLFSSEDSTYFLIEVQMGVPAHHLLRGVTHLHLDSIRRNPLIHQIRSERMARGIVKGQAPVDVLFLLHSSPKDGFFQFVCIIGA